MIIFTTRFWRTPFFMGPVLVMGLWLFPQEECNRCPEGSFRHALAETGPQRQDLVTESLNRAEPVLPRDSFRQPPDPKVRSLQRASALLRQAADVLDKDKNERLAVRFVREAIGILKHEVIPWNDAPDYDRVLLPLALLSNKALERTGAGPGSFPIRNPRFADSRLIQKCITSGVGAPRSHCAVIVASRKIESTVSADE